MCYGDLGGNEVYKIVSFCRRSWWVSFYLNRIRESEGLMVVECNFDDSATNLEKKNELEHVHMELDEVSKVGNEAKFGRALQFQ
ncbi:uncharacterized protein LOC112173632 isoform X2 [Rosa chinensis]|nr:uncharacterized protein LOC112173632 isoform X2 [Rosa chinensis]